MNPISLAVIVVAGCAASALLLVVAAAQLPVPDRLVWWEAAMIGAAGHLWVLGIGQGALLGLVAAALTIGVMRLVPRD